MHWEKADPPSSRNRRQHREQQGRRHQDGLVPAQFFTVLNPPSAEGEDTLYRTVSWIPGGEWSQRYSANF